MTKEEFLKNISSHEEWLVSHNKYVENALTGFKPYFEVDRFIEDHKKLANEDVIKCHLADAYENNNYELGELEDYLARHFLIPYEDVVQYRTQKFWDEIKDN